jgi:hypothetical protein
MFRTYDRALVLDKKRVGHHTSSGRSFAVFENLLTQRGGLPHLQDVHTFDL